MHLSPFWMLLRALFLVHKWPIFLSVLTWLKMQSLSVVFYKSTNLRYEGSTSWSNHLQRSHLGELYYSTWICERHYIQFTASRFCSGLLTILGLWLFYSWILFKANRMKRLLMAIRFWNPNPTFAIIFWELK
jgi:hypothetical protein